MRTSVLAACCAVAALAVPSTAAVGTPGPFAGVLAEGDTRSHVYDNNPTNMPCLQVMAGYSVRLSYSPPTDRVSLSAFGVSVTGSNGAASLHAVRSYCTRFGLSVTGTDVAGLASYTVTVTRDSGSGGTLVGPSRS